MLHINKKTYFEVSIDNVTLEGFIFEYTDSICFTTGTILPKRQVIISLYRKVRM